MCTLTEGSLALVIQGKPSSIPNMWRVVEDIARGEQVRCSHEISGRHSGEIRENCTFSGKAMGICRLGEKLWERRDRETNHIKFRFGKYCSILQGELSLTVRGSPIRIQEAWPGIEEMARQEGVTAKHGNVSRTGEAGGDIREIWIFSGDAMGVCTLAERLCERMEVNGTIKFRL
jgi:hypothetical protein